MPPGHPNGLVKHNGRPCSIGSDDIVVLFCLIRDRRDAGGRDIANDLIRCHIGYVVHRGEQTWNLGDNRVASAGSLSIVVDTSIYFISRSLP